MRATPVLIRGGPGLGKTRLARRIHEGSDRSAAPFAIADAQRAPLCWQELQSAALTAGEGSLLIVGIDRLGPELQDFVMAMLSAPPFRLMATAGSARDTLRPDLDAALRAHEIVVPPLVDRPEDTVWLAARLFPALNARRPAPLVGITASAEDAIRAYDWPGNGRELRARLLRAVEAATGEMILPADLFPEWAGDEAIRPLSEVRDTAERVQIAAALERTQGQTAEAAKLLRVSRTTLWEKMQKLGL